MSKKTIKLKEKIEELKSDIKYHRSNVRLLLNNPTNIQIEELKFQYAEYDHIIMAGRQPSNTETIGNGMYDLFANKEVKMHKFPKEELESKEYHISKHSPVNVVDDKKVYGISDDKPIEKNYLSEKEMIFDLPVGVEGWRSFIINGILIHAPNDKSPEDWTRVIETLKNLPVCKINEDDKPNKYNVEKDVKLGSNYVGDVKFQKSDLLDKSWIEVKKENAKWEAEQLSAQVDINKDGVTGNTPLYSPEHLEAKKNLFARADETFKKSVDEAIEAGTHKSPDKWVIVKVKEGSIIIPPDVKGITMVKGMPNQFHVGDLSKCVDHECKPVEELPKTLESLDKIDMFIGLREKSSITNGNKDIVFKKSAELDSLNGSKVFYYNTEKPSLKYSPYQMLSDWKSNYVKPL